MVKDDFKNALNTLYAHHKAKRVVNIIAKHYKNQGAKVVKLDTLDEQIVEFFANSKNAELVYNLFVKLFEKWGL